MDVAVVYGTGDIAEVEARIAAGSDNGTRYFALGADQGIAAVFAVTGLGRLRPGTPPRLLLHELKIGSGHRATNVLDDILGWLESELQVGTQAELVALTPPGQLPEAFARRGLVEVLGASKWEVAR